MALNPFTQVEQQAGVADYAMPYVESMLGATQKQLFNIDPSGQITGLRGYTPYSYNAADYFAGFTPLQQQAQQGAANLSLPSSFGQAMGLTGQTYGNLMGLGSQASRAGQQYGRMATNPYAVQSYMNPYLMSSLAPQMQLLGQQQAQQANQLAGQATQAGAFGGSRYGIQKGLQDQANQLAMSNLVGQGFNNAYNQALQNMQFGANLGLQGQQAAAGMYGQGLNAANQLSNIGNQALQAQQGILGTQSQFGGQQQALQQQILNQAVQNYNTAQQYPYQQLGFMQNMLQGLPIATQSQQYYQQAPTMAQNLAALGMGLSGANALLGGGQGGTGGTSGGSNLISGLNQAGQFISGIPSTISKVGNAISDAGSWVNQNLLGGIFAEGGQVEGYAEGGQVESIVEKLSDQQLMQALQAAQARGDFQQSQAVQEEMATRASERGGLAGAFNRLPAQTRTMMAARGGMVAFYDNPDQPVSQDMPSFDPMSTGVSQMASQPTTDTDTRNVFERMMGAPKEPEWKRKHREESGKPQPKAPTYVDSDAAERADRMSGLPSNIVSAAPTQVVRQPSAVPTQPTQPAVTQAAPNSSQSIYNQLIADLNKPAPARQDRGAAVREGMELRRSVLGENPANALAESLIKQQDAERINALNQGRGLAALSAMSGMLQPGGFMRGLAAAGSQFSNAYSKVLADDRTARSNLMQAQVHLADSKYKAKVGDFDSARQDYKDYEDRMDKADIADKARKMGIADIVHKMETEKNQAAQTRAMAAHYGKPTGLEYAMNIVNQDPKYKDKSPTEKLEAAAKLVGAVSLERAGMGQNAKLNDAIDKIEKEYSVLKYMKPDSPTAQQMAADKQRRLNEAYRLYGQPQGGGAGSSGSVLKFDAKGNPI